MSDFTKIKHHKGSVELEWTTSVDNDFTKHSLASFDEPEKEFAEALQALAPMVCLLLDLPPEYKSDLTITSVSLSYNDSQGRGCVITSLKKLPGFNAPLVLNTPHLPEESEHGPTMPGYLIQALNNLSDYAIRFRNGQRMQADMFAGAAS